MQPVLKARSDRAPVRGRRVPPVRAAGAEGRPAILGATHLRIWAPVLARVLAFGLALLGLAGIGMAASRSPALSALADGSLGLEIAPLPGPSGDVSAAAAASVGSAAVSAPAATPQPPAADVGTPSAAPDPCPKASAPTAPPDAATLARAPRPEGQGVLADGRVVLNRATSSELRRLPGVGAKRAELIVALRQRLGRFKRPGDLLRIKGIGPRTLERMLPHLVLDAD